MRLPRALPLHQYLWVLFGSLVFLVGALSCGINYLMTKAALEAATADTTRRISQQMLDEVDELLAPAQIAVKLVSHSSLAEARTLQARMARLGLVRDALENAPALQSLYIGYADGAFFYVRSLRQDSDRAIFKAPATAAYAVRSVERSGTAPTGQTSFFDADLAHLSTVDDTDFARRFDPRARAWYQAAMASEALVRTDPYLFFSDREAGSTFASRTPERRAVVGGDFRLDFLGQMLARKKATASTMLALLDSRGKVLGIDSRLPESSTAPDVAQADLHAAAGAYGIPILTALASAMSSSGGAPRRETLSVDGVTWYTTTDPIPAPKGKPLFLLSAVPEDELLADARYQAWIGIAVTVGIVLLCMPLLWLVSRRIARPLDVLSEGLEGIHHFDFHHPLSVQTQIREVNALSSATEQMRQTIRRFLIIVQAIAAEGRLEQLLPVLLKKTLNEAEGKAGIFYLADGDDLAVVAAQDCYGNDMAPGLSRLSLGQALPLIRTAASEGSPQSGCLTKDELQSAALGALSLGEVNHAVAMPLVNRQHELQGLILVLRETPMEAAQLAFVSTLASLYAGAIEVRELTNAQRELFNAFIRLLADAIDAKSPHTGGHCSRVPELARMLAQAACDAREGPFQSFSMSEAQWEALHVAAWLHDCGKVTTPEYIIDKATKLETLYDRLHEVRMRFEVLKREAEIRCLRGIAAGEDAADAISRRDTTLQELDDDFAFVAECNQGGESMDAGRKERLRRIAARTWTRTLDDRIGLSPDERARKAGIPAAALPAQEPLLADKPEHLVPRSVHDTIAAGNPWGFKRNTPAYLYHRGELHNLMVGRGTLCEEERFKIEDHIVQTQIMLSRLPFPKHLRQVPEIAGSHHEKMDGTGYPRQLRQEDMSPLARMLAVADIFEALTAADRPYKKAKTLSESVHIMSVAAAQHHIDPELFQLFLASGVYMQYAQRFMHADQIDEVDIARYGVRSTTRGSAET